MGQMKIIFTTFYRCLKEYHRSRVFKQTLTFSLVFCQSVEEVVETALLFSSTSIERGFEL